MIILKGFLSQTHNGITTIRGSAAVKDIIACSKPGDFQRSIIEGHKQDLVEFYREAKDVFFPEVVLALELSYDFTKDDTLSQESDWNQILMARGNFTSNVDSFEIRITKSRNKSDWAIPASIRFKSKTDDGKRLLHRLDGNHRLEALKEYALLDDRVWEYQIPFCVVLLIPNLMDKTCKTLFHNINSKAVPLMNEFLLSTIIKDPKFTDERLGEPDFGPAYIFTRQMNDRGILNTLPHLNSCLIDPDPEDHPVPLTFLKEIFEMVDCSDLPPENRTEQSISDSLIKLEAFLEANEEIAKTRCIGLLHALIKYCLSDNYKFTAFKTWATENHLFRMSNIRCNEITAVFDAILDSISKTIFIAMPFYTTTNKTYKDIKDVIHDLNQEFNLGLELRPLRIDKKRKGQTFDVMQDILNHIEECGLMLADLTFGNANVYYEIGYKMGIEQTRGDRFKNLICFHVGIAKNYPKPDADKDVMFDLKHLNLVRAINYKDMKEKLREQICIRYKLKEKQYE